MNCLICKKKAEISLSYTKAKYCKNHFYTLIEKRVRKDLRTAQPIDIKKTYTFKNDNSPLAQLTEQLLKSIYKDRIKFDKNAEKKILVSPLEYYISNKFTQFLNKKIENEKHILPLRSVSIEEINILMKANLNQEDFLHPLLKQLENKQPGTIFSMKKMFDELNISDRQAK